MTGRWWVFVCALITAGCLLPDRTKLGRDGGDAGSDAGPDVGIPDDAGDGGTDAGDACVIAEQHEASCDNTRDDDCDGLTDCNDFDCGRALYCCGPGRAERVFPFETGAGWRSLPTGVLPSIEPEGGIISNFPSSEPRATRYDECLSIDLGMELRSILRARGLRCSSGSPCPYASLVLTPVSEMARGVPLADELSVRLYADSRIEVQRAGVVLARGPMPFGAGNIDVRIRLSPGVDEQGDAWIFADVRIVSADLTWSPWEGSRPLVPREDLIGASLGCAEARGLYLALEGMGGGVDIDSVSIDPYECANPSHFERPTGAVPQIERSVLGIDPSWSLGGIGAPALSSYFVDDEPPETWTLLYDATNVPRTNELTAPVRFSIGLSQSTRSSGDGWTVRGDPLLGTDPPHCSGCLTSVREPTILLPIRDHADGSPGHRGLSHSSSGWVVYASEIEGSGGRRFELEARSLIASPIGTGATQFTLLTPASELGGCTSLRDPLLLPVASEDTDDAWLLYSCERDGTLREIRIARFSVSGSGPAARPMGVALTANQVGTFASISLRAADGATWIVDDDLVIHRLWFVTRDLRGRTAVAFAEASGPRNSLPIFEPYAANPVLRADDPIFGECDAVSCEIESLAVTRIANSPHRVRLLVARTIRMSSDTQHVLVPLEQIWPAPRP
jgi:hypothetical protein